jgi:hypothetical protein
VGSVPTIHRQRRKKWWARCALPTLQERFQGENMPAAFFVVRATVTDPARREAFGTWYSREHLPDAMRSFGALKAWRYWSDTDPSLHHAMYQFADKAALERAVEGPELKRLVADFNRDWPDVTRTREVLLLAEELVA